MPTPKPTIPRRDSQYVVSGGREAHTPYSYQASWIAAEHCSDKQPASSAPPILSVCVFVCSRCNLELFSSNCGESGSTVSGGFACYLIHYAELAEKEEFRDFDGVSASSTTSALCKVPAVNMLASSSGEGISICTGFCTDSSPNL